jgi:hypothetical protein
MGTNTAQVSAVAEDDEDGPLSLEELKVIASAALQGAQRAGRGGQYRDSLLKIMDWAANARIEAAMLEGVLAGTMGTYIDEDTGEQMFISLKGDASS